MDSYRFLLSLAIILFSTKLFGLISQRVQLPSVVGALLAGILLGPTCLGWVADTDFLIKTSELGVIFLMFLAGLDTDLKELTKTGLTSLAIAACGVIVPLAGGYLCYVLFFPTASAQDLMRALFIGVVLTATSVSITVETLRELGHLRGKVGTAILGAAVIDDILGIIVLTVITSFTDPAVKPLLVFGRIIGFFLLLAVVGVLVYRLFKKMGKAYYNHRRIAIYGLVFCLLLSFTAEEFFGIADITGAYFAGLILCNVAEAQPYIARKINIASYMLFSPIFFASIGIKTDLHGFTSTLLLFAVALTVMAILTKVLGCGLGAKLCRFSNHQALSVGVGMISRGEVALIVAQKGEQAGLVSQSLFPAIVAMVIVTTLITPVLLKIVLNRDTQPLDESGPVLDVKSGG